MGYYKVLTLLCYLQNDDLLSEQFVKTSQTSQTIFDLVLFYVCYLCGKHDGFPASVRFHGIRAIAEIIGMFSTDLRP